MRLRNSIVVGVLVFSFFPRSIRAQGNLVVNGGFTSDASGWSAINVAAGGGYSSKSGEPAGCFFLDTLSSSLADPTISQTLNGLIPGISYNVSGNYLFGPNGVGSTSANFGVAVDGNFLFETAAQAPAAWYSFDFLYTATSSALP